MPIGDVLPQFGEPARIELATVHNRAVHPRNAAVGGR